MKIATILGTSEHMGLLNQWLGLTSNTREPEDKFSLGDGLFWQQCTLGLALLDEEVDEVDEVDVVELLLGP